MRIMAWKLKEMLMENKWRLRVEDRHILHRSQHFFRKATAQALKGWMERGPALVLLIKQRRSGSMACLLGQKQGRGTRYQHCQGQGPCPVRPSPAGSHDLAGLVWERPRGLMGQGRLRGRNQSGPSCGLSLSMDRSESLVPLGDTIRNGMGPQRLWPPFA